MVITYFHKVCDNYRLTQAAQQVQSRQRHQPALLGIADLVFDLQTAGACLDHLLGQQARSVLIAEARIDIRATRWPREIVLGQFAGLAATMNEYE